MELNVFRLRTQAMDRVLGLYVFNVNFESEVDDMSGFAAGFEPDLGDPISGKLPWNLRREMIDLLIRVSSSEFREHVEKMLKSVGMYTKMSKYLFLSFSFSARMRLILRKFWKTPKAFIRDWINSSPSLNNTKRGGLRTRAALRTSSATSWRTRVRADKSLASQLRRGLNYWIFQLNFLTNLGNFTEFCQNFANFLEFSRISDIFEHVREIPTKFHLDFDEKYHFLVENCEFSIEFSIFNFAKMLVIFCWNSVVWTVQRNADLVDLKKCCKMSIHL